MRRNFLVAVLSMFTLAVPQFASAGQQGSFGGYRQRDEYRASAQSQQRYQQPQSKEWNQGSNSRAYENRAFDNRGYDNRGQDSRNFDDRRSYGNEYRGGAYGYERYGDRHVGRSVAIIGGSAAGGALIGGVVGQGRGAAVGAVVGGVAGLIGDQLARHHQRR